ncbi:hypothetical protein HDIA_0704 [Hartmannibacter diazotrophicus]|uniref:Uncharacterized protein n=2 Tax=Hartmannibacter diazotrophicus TaxID=1482074 RepID=A0A2C9D440_9HYPH|nr:hypothetical protein HDIA_0704 [Hartmannibacter diazotrophicus]
MRERLSNRRYAETFDFVHTNPEGKGSEFRATVGTYEDGRVGEVFVNFILKGRHKPSTDQDINVRDAAILLSFALQNGTRLADIAPAMTRGEGGEPHGIMGTLLDQLVEFEAKMEGVSDA